MMAPLHAHEKETKSGCKFTHDLEVKDALSQLILRYSALR